MSTTALRAQWLTAINTYGQKTDSTSATRLAGAAKVAGASNAPGTAGWYATALAVFWS